MKNNKASFITEPTRKTPVIADVDVLIVGGGPAGSGAGVFAARSGAKTLIAERYSFLGGMATQGLYASWPRDRGLGLQPYGGVPQELMDRLVKEKSTWFHEIKSRKPGSKTYAKNVRYNEEILKLVLGEMVAEAGAEVIYHSLGVAPIMQDGCIKGVIIENKNGRQAILAKAVIDSSGDADIAARAGAPFKKYANKDQSESLPKYFEDFDLASPYTKDHAGALTPFDMRFVLNNIDWERVDNKLVREFWGKSHDPKLQVQLQGFRRGNIWTEGMMKFATLVRGKDAANAMDFNWGEIALKQAMLNFLRTVRKCPGFEEAHVVKMSHQAEVRATRRVTGDYVITKEDCVAGRKFPDAIAVTIPRGLHRKTVFLNAPPDTKVFHGIPYRCLLPLNVEGLLTAGRCISSEFLAFQGHPSIPACMLIGQAAGVAAALAAKNNVLPRKVDVTTLQKRLIEMGAELEKGIPGSKI